MVAAAGAAAVVVGSQSASAIAQVNLLPSLFAGWNKRNFSSIRAHERDHVNFLVNTLGTAAFPDPGFINLEQRTAQDFAATSRILENTGVATYLGAAPLIFDSGVLAAAASIALVEARHAGYLNTLRNVPIDNSVVKGTAPDESFESPQTPMVTAQAIAKYLPNPNLGYALAAAISTTPSAENDIAILRFALALEYLERDYYNLNVPKFLYVMN